jgi:gamma-glutamyl hercynylcysteine S-oxide synthase
MHHGKVPPDSEALFAYRRMLIEQLRYMVFAGLNVEGEHNLLLADRYIERTLVTLGAEPDAPDSRKLADLAHAPAARVALVGEPFAGKTTCLHRLALACAGGQEAASYPLADWPGLPPLPILLRARESLALVGASEIGEDLPSPFAFLPAIEAFVQSSDMGLPGQLAQALETGGCLVLIDGDHLADAGDGAIFRMAIERFVARHPDNRYIVTCRSPMVDALLPLAGFAAYTLAPLGDQEVDGAIAGWYPGLAGEADLAPDALAERIGILQGRLRGDERLRSLVGNPLALELCVRAYAGGCPLSALRPAVLRQLIALASVRVGAEHTPDHAAPVTAAQQLSLLQALALEIHSLSRPSATPDALPYASVEALLCEGLAAFGVPRQRAIEQIVPHMLASWQRQGLVLAAGVPPSYGMPWQPLRDYLAARALAARPDFMARAFGLRDDPRWREIVLFATYELAREGAPVAALALPRLLIDAAPRGERGAPDILLAAQCLREIKGYMEPEPGLRDEVCERLTALTGLRAAPIADRLKAGLLLGHLGDPRFSGPLPPLVQVAAGPFVFGSLDGYEDEGPVQRVDLPAFAIGVHPVTNQEYARFLAAAPSYPRPRYWHDQRFNNPSQPVVGVTWEDASSYCAWLTASLRQAGLIADELVVRLPLEAEWEKAASWEPKRRVKRRYPWGNEWSSARANTADGRGSWLTAPVGCYPDGVSAYGVHDLIGNVWEWTASEYASYPGAAAPFHEVGSYTLRGSSCASLPSNTRCTFRSRLPTNYWRYHLGFRIVVARSSASSQSSVVSRQYGGSGY